MQAGFLPSPTRRGALSPSPSPCFAHQVCDTANSPEAAEQRLEWDLLETVLQGAGLASPPVRRLFDALRAEVRLRRPRPGASFRANLDVEPFNRLLEIAREVPPEVRLQVRKCLTGSAVGSVIGHLPPASLVERRDDRSRVRPGTG